MAILLLGIVVFLNLDNVLFDPDLEQKSSILAPQSVVFLLSPSLLQLYKAC